jgi:hypothetical protein
MKMIDQELYIATEEFVKKVLIRMGQQADANNPKLVRQVVAKILLHFPTWVKYKSNPKIDC